MKPSQPSATPPADPQADLQAASLRSQLLQELARLRDAGEDITRRGLSAQLAQKFGCSRALVIGARRTVLQQRDVRAWEDLRQCFAAPIQDGG